MRPQKEGGGRLHRARLGVLRGVWGAVSGLERVGPSAVSVGRGSLKSLIAAACRQHMCPPQ
jgi:hypothetical protein